MNCQLAFMIMDRVVTFSNTVTILYFNRLIPPEIGDLVELRELMLNNNLLRALPTEIGKLFQLLVSLANTKSLILVSYNIENTNTRIVNIFQFISFSEPRLERKPIKLRDLQHLQRT